MLEVTDLRKSFGSLIVTDGVSLSIAAGAREAVIGPNGAGKTTFFNLLSGELRPDAGTIALGGRDITGLAPNRRVKAGLARSFQRNNLFLDMTVEESLATACAVSDGVASVFWRSFASAGRVHARAAELAERVGLADHLPVQVRHLSYGSQRQLEIALALAARPSLLLLDEPTAGMSPEETKSMQHLVASLPRDITLLLIEHDMDVVFDLCDRITVLDYGKVLLQGRPAEIRQSALVREIYLGEAG
ncbi:MAG: ABC transporter ATP-binding protein [Alphaproteobacteria bacterium]